MAVTYHEEVGQDEAFPWDIGVFDAHCHPTDIMSSVDDIGAMKARVLTIMATRLQDQELVSEAAGKLGFSSSSLDSNDNAETAPCQVIPSFGWHPWFSHQLYDDVSTPGASIPAKLEHYQAVLTPAPFASDEPFLSALPDPRPLSGYLSQARALLQRHPLALVGEVGLDRSFRVPDGSTAAHPNPEEPVPTPGTREGRLLSRHRVEMAHQRAVLRAQLGLAGALGRGVSVHGVGAHGAVFEALHESWSGCERSVPSRRERKRRRSAEGAHALEEEESDGGTESGRVPYPPRICLHSYSGPPDMAKQYTRPEVPAVVFFSFSVAVNLGTPAAHKTREVIRTVPHDRLLVESDFHAAGPRMDAALEEMVRVVCAERGWSLDAGVRQLGSNWRHFALGRTE